MESREYILEFDNARRAEPAVRDFLLQKCDVVRFTVVRTWSGCLFPRKIGGNKDPHFRKTLEALQDDFIESEVNNLKYNVEQGKRLFTHCYYRLSPQLKALFKKEGILYFPFMLPEKESSFYGYEDPNFCKAGDDSYEIIGSVVSHEPYIQLYIDSEDKASINEKLRAKKIRVEWS